MNKAAIRDDFYTLWDREGNRDEFIEIELSNFENRFQPLKKTLRSPNAPSDAELVEIKNLAVVQHIRSSRQRDFLRMLAGLESSAESATATTNLKFESIDAVESYLAQQPDVENKRQEFDTFARIALPAAIEALRSTFAWLYVCVLKSGAHDFITSDHPVSPYDPTSDKRKTWGEYPYHRLPLEVTYPLTKRSCALMSYMEMPRTATADAKIVTAINARTAAFCEKEVFLTPSMSNVDQQRLLSDITHHALWQKPLLWRYAIANGGNTFRAAVQHDHVKEALDAWIPRYWWLGFEAIRPEVKAALIEKMKPRPGN